MIKRFLSLSIRTHLIVLVCLLAFPSMVIVVYSGLLEREHAIENSLDSCKRFINTVATEQQSVVMGAEQLMMALSLLHEIQSRNIYATNAILSNLPRKNIHYSIITVADKNGLIWASSVPVKGKTFLADRKYFQDVLRTSMFTSGGLVMGKITKKPILVFGSPIRNRANVLSGVMSIGLLLNHVQNAFEKENFPAGSSISILDHKGIIIYTHFQQSLPQKLQGSRDIKEELFTTMQQGPNEGTFTAVGNDGNHRFFSYKKLRLSDDQEPYMYIRASITQEAATAETTAKMSKYLFILGLMFVFGISVSWLIGKRGIVDRLAILNVAALKLSEGKEHVNTSAIVQGGEIGKLAHIFDNMAAALTEREEALRESEQWYRMIYNNAPLGIMHFDSSGTIIDFNDKFAQIMGAPREKILGFNMLERLADQEMLKAVKDALASQHGYYEGDYLSVTGERVTSMRAIYQSITGEDGKFIGAVGIFEDITERRRLERELTEYREHLEELVLKRTTELARSNADLEQFAYVASHDLQEPLRMVASFTQLLAKRYKGKLDSDADEFISFAVDGANRMQRLINDLLAYSRVTTRRSPFGQVDCDKVLDSVINSLSLAIDESGTAISRDPLPTIMGDPSQVGQVFQNLITNAIKFRSDDPLQIHISVALKDNDWVFSVRDNGIGLAPNHYERIFVIFQRLIVKKDTAGTGIGLAICKKIVEDHGGHIWVESRPGEGSTFYFTIPLRQVSNNRKKSNNII
jgi:PAS domain S-box-containing protein